MKFRAITTILMILWTVNSLCADEGNKDISKVEDYNSHNTTRLGVDETVELLLKLDYVQEQLK